MSDHKNKKLPLQAGPAVALVRSEPADRDEQLERQELAINQKIREIRQEAYGAGFFMTVQSVAHAANGCYVILYELEADPRFRDPIG